MKILIPCEFSGIVREAFARKGHDAWSCDLLPTEIPGKHLQGNVLNILEHNEWDMMIAFPPCTYLTVTANRAFLNNPERWKKRLEAMLFIHKLMSAPIEKIAIENPKGVISTHIRKPDQYIQPYEHGHSISKMTGLWLKNLPLITPTKRVTPEWKVTPSGKRMSKWHWDHPTTNNLENQKIRSRTFKGVAEAMAEQWS